MIGIGRTVTACLHYIHLHLFSSSLLLGGTNIDAAAWHPFSSTVALIVQYENLRSSEQMSPAFSADKTSTDHLERVREGEKEEVLVCNTKPKQRQTEMQGE